MFRIWLLFLLLLTFVISGCDTADTPEEVLPPADEDLVFVEGRPLEPMDRSYNIIDPLGDIDTSHVDFDTVRAQVENGRLFLQIRTNKEISLQGNSGLFLAIDADNNPSTGAAPHAEGAELVWSFGQRQGVYEFENQRETFRWADLGIITAPTVTSDLFEVAIPLDATLLGLPVFTADTVGIAMIYNPEEGVLDRAPDEGFARVELTETRGEPKQLSLIRPDTATVRLVAWNVLFDGIVERGEQFDKILDVIQPDIAVLTEMWDTPAAVTIDLFNEWLPLPGGSSWHAERHDDDVVTVSRWPILGSWDIPDARATAYLLQVPDWETPLFVIGAHAPCCGKDTERQAEIDAFMSFLRDAQRGIGPVTLPEGTPVVITGDMNLVGKSRQLETLLTGDLLNEDEYGEDFSPDVDGTALEDLYPRHPLDMLAYTWRAEDSSYGPGKLDYIVVSDANLDVVHSYVLDTRLLPDSLLQKHNLQRMTSAEASDHLPVVADMKMR